MSESTVTPRWVLYDADREAVEAKLRRPAERQAKRLQPGDEIDTTRLRGDHCVRVSALNGKSVPTTLRVELSSGRFAPCMQNKSGTDLFYTNGSCTGTMYARRPQAQMIGGELYIARGTVVDGNNLYRASGNGSCEAETHGDPVLPLERAPDWLTTAFDNPPYEVKPVYD